MNAPKMTPLQWEVLLTVAKCHLHQGLWYRAARSGERVTLASLFRSGLLMRQAHRGNEGEGHAAHEYKLSAMMREELSARLVDTGDIKVNAFGAFQNALQAHLDNPSKETWNALATKVVPGAAHTVWQAWVKIDSGAPISLPSTKGEVSADRWPNFPDPFTTRRAVRAIYAGRVPSGLGALLAGRVVSPKTS
jgi:hypothetical protein